MPRPQTHRFPPSRGVPNNPDLPVLIYSAALPADAGAIERHIDANGWECRWRDGVFDFHHFHSTAHETLAIARGSARLQLGGADGEVFEVAPGDVLVLPAWTGHKRLEASANFLVIGAYPPGQDYEIEMPTAGSLGPALEAIANVPVPDSDPVSGKQGELMRLWRA